MAGARAFPMPSPTTNGGTALSRAGPHKFSGDEGTEQPRITHPSAPVKWKGNSRETSSWGRAEKEDFLSFLVENLPYQQDIQQLNLY